MKTIGLTIPKDRPKPPEEKKEVKEKGSSKEESFS